MTEFDYMDLPEEDRELIKEACNFSDRVYLAPMDKGLSRATVWQARWQIVNQIVSRLHVFKIGEVTKIQKEWEAINTIVSPIEPVGFARIFESNNKALLRLEFQGVENSTISLRQYLQPEFYKTNFTRLFDNSDTKNAISIVRKLYLERLNNWHPQNGRINGKVGTIEVSSLSEKFPKLNKKIDLLKVANQMGKVALNEMLREKFNLDVEMLAEQVEKIASQKFTMEVGPVHGDLHAQNVNLDENLNLYIIDYGSTSSSWRAIDFLIMECALKFVVSPAHAMLKDLDKLDNLIEKQWDYDENIIEDLNNDDFQNSIYGKELQKIAACVCEVRLCAKKLGIIVTKEEINQYRMGLIFVTASLTPIEQLINRLFLFNSLANQCQILNRTV